MVCYYMLTGWPRAADQLKVRMPTGAIITTLGSLECLFVCPHCSVDLLNNSTPHLSWSISCLMKPCVGSARARFVPKPNGMTHCPSLGRVFATQPRTKC